LAVDILTPTGAADAQARTPAPRRAGLAGCRIGVLDNSKPNADALLGRVAELIAERTAGVAVRVWRKPGSSRPATNIEEVVASSDVVLTGSGD
jgi:hypothetical protein